METVLGHDAVMSPARFRNYFANRPSPGVDRAATQAVGAARRARGEGGQCRGEQARRGAGTGPDRSSP
jgi:hypothetical protein